MGVGILEKLAFFGAHVGGEKGEGDGEGTEKRAVFRRELWVCHEDIQLRAMVSGGTVGPLGVRVSEFRRDSRASVRASMR